MNSSYEVISVFLDDEPFDPEELARALSDPAGRALLLDLVALRGIVQPADQGPAVRRVGPMRPPLWRVAAAAAALLCALGGGYLVGERRASPSSSEAPPPTRIVHAVPFNPAGGM